MGKIVRLIRNCQLISIFYNKKTSFVTKEVFLIKNKAVFKKLFLLLFYFHL